MVKILLSSTNIWWLDLKFNRVCVYPYSAAEHWYSIMYGYFPKPLISNLTSMFLSLSNSFHVLGWSGQQMALTLFSLMLFAIQVSLWLQINHVLPRWSCRWQHRAGAEHLSQRFGQWLHFSADPCQRHCPRTSWRSAGRQHQPSARCYQHPHHHRYTPHSPHLFVRLL